MKYHLPFFFLFIVFCSCGSDQRIPGNRETIALGHGGNGFIGFFGSEAPNSIQSIKSAVAHEDTKGLEVDCQLLADGTLLLYHDQFLDSQTHCEGEVAYALWQEIKNCKYDLIIESEENVLWNLDGLLKLVQKRGMTISLDIKIFPDGRNRDSLFVEFDGAIRKSLKKNDFDGTLFVESNSYKLLSYLKDTHLPAKLYFYANEFEKGRKIALNKGFDGLSISNEKFTADQVINAQKDGLFIMIFGAKNEKLNLEALAKNPDYLQTDDLKHIQTMIYSDDGE